MAQAPDMELKKAFAELHDKMIDTRQKMKLSDLQIENFRRLKQRAELMQLELRTMPANTKTYESVGRMFLLQDLDTLKSDLIKHQKTADEKIRSLENNKEYLQKNLEESENNIREIVQKKKNLSSS